MPGPSRKQKFGFLVAGLQLPTLVLLSLFGANIVTTAWDPAWRILVIVLSASGAFAAGCFILWWLALRLYRRSLTL